MSELVDVYVGKRVRQQRTALGMSQENLASKLGVTFQQVQKYEKGANRIGASRLFQVSQALQVPISHFFEGFSEIPGKTKMPPAFVSTGAAPHAAVFEDSQPMQDDIMSSHETIELLRAYYSIEDEATRRKLLESVKSAAASAEHKRSK